jgi:hypothetical protein
MGRFLAGVASALLLAAAGLFFWNGMDTSKAALPDAPVAEPDYALADTPVAPAASAKSKEEKRFMRFDKDKNGAVSAAEYLISRQKAYAKLDANRDGVLQFSEYAAKTTLKFSKADGDKSGALTRTEFATTRVVRKSPPRRKLDCPPVNPLRAPESEGSGDDDA